MNNSLLTHLRSNPCALNDLSIKLARFSLTAVDFNQDGGDGSMKMASDSST